MNIIEWLNSNLDAGNAIIFSLIALAVWFILWHLMLKKLLVKCDWGYDLVNMGPALGPGAAFGILLFFFIIAVLFIASIQAVLTIGAKMIFPLLIFWGGIITFFVLLIRHIKK